ncbi:hypothetical protein DPMN_090830 [Dreissena polymorpha]|uniref:Uncharacterized protein n=1 Tax=Dreissena polymorpha TaxID=45954 RepID=A0A9D4KYG7_DREPO|nr:hypothetical protein DPMN_090830 [Dreissena polymorpha]
MWDQWYTLTTPLYMTVPAIHHISGRHPRLAIDALLCLHCDDINARYANEYTRKLRQCLTTSYRKAKEITSKTAEIKKRKYYWKIRAAKLVLGDLVLVRNVTLRGIQKIADR